MLMYLGYPYEPIMHK